MLQRRLKTYIAYCLVVKYLSALLINFYYNNIILLLGTSIHIFTMNKWYENLKSLNQSIFDDGTMILTTKLRTSEARVKLKTPVVS